MSAIQVVEPQGNSSNFRAAFFSFLAMLAILVDWYHGSYYIFNKMSYDTWIGAVVNFVIAFAIGSCAVALKPATIMLVNSYRMKDPMITKALAGTVLVVILIGVFVATQSSFNTQSEVRDRDATAHSSSLETLEARKNTIESTYQMAKIGAERVMKTDPERGQRMLQAAQLRKDRALQNLSADRTKALADAPLKQEHDAGVITIGDNVRNVILSAALTLAGVVFTVFSVLHIRAEHRIPVFSLAPKLNHDWVSYKENYQSSNFNVDPLRGIFKGLFFGHKADVITPAERNETPIIIGSSNDQKAPDSPAGSPQTKATTGTPTTAHNDEERVWFQCPSCKTLYHPLRKKMDIRATQNASKNLPEDHVKCTKCPAEFEYKKTMMDEQTAYKIMDAINNPSSNKETKESAGNSQEITGNSQELTSDNNDLSTTGNSRESAGNYSEAGKSPEIPAGNNPVNQAPVNQTGESTVRNLDLSHICQQSSIEDKLAQLESTIDELAADPKNDGIFCSPTEARKAIGGRYEAVKAVFKAKMREGKIGRKSNKYIITYKESA